MTDLHYGESKAQDERSDAVRARRAVRAVPVPRVRTRGTPGRRNAAHPSPLPCCIDARLCAGLTDPCPVAASVWLPLSPARPLRLQRADPCAHLTSKARLLVRGATSAHAVPAVQFQQAVLSAEKPDLVIFSGDLVSGWVCRSGQGGSACGPGWWEARWAQLTAPVRAAAVPWAITLGNHE